MYMANIGNASLNDAQRKLVEDNVGLVYAQVHKRGIYDEDLIQEGMLGLINAARFYSPEFGAKFSTYAASYIWAALFGTYSDKKYAKNAALTDSLDDPDKNIQPPVDGCFFDLYSNADPLVNDVIKCICEGMNKKEVCLVLGLIQVDKSGSPKLDKDGNLIPNTSKLNSILDKVGRDLYGERYVKKENK
jgi:RNA polymerase sigma factor (sigma-70 family)|nr:MAG TPA: DNA directed RNA polymerase subunit [Caudoviricetes sp.]